MVGAASIALTRTGAKRTRLKELGAAHVIATEEQDLVAEVERLTGGQGARVVFDPVGDPTLAKLAAAAARLGIIFEYGALSTEPTPLPLFNVLGKWLTIRGYVVVEITSDPRLNEAKRFILDGLIKRALKPVIARTFHLLDKIVEANRYLESNEQIGKIVVTV